MSKLPPEESIADDAARFKKKGETAQDIVADYLHTMLDSAFSVATSEEIAPEEDPLDQETPQKRVASSNLDVKKKEGVDVNTPLLAITQPQPQPQPQPEPECQPPELSPWETDELEWLLVSAGRLNLAFPLIGLESVQAFDKKVTPFASTVEWLPGLTRVKNTHIRLVDIASYLMHEPSRLNDCQNVLVLNNSSWGLLVDRIISTKTITRHEMRRPAVSGRYSWRFGALVDPVYTLIDPLRLSEALEHSLGKPH